MKAKVYVTLKREVLDPQGDAVKRSLASIGFDVLKNVRVGKFIELDIDADSKDIAEEKVKEMCDQLLANPVIEDYRFEVT